MKHPNQELEIHPLTGRVSVECHNHEPTMTQQQYKDECDVNLIMKKFATTGEFTHKTSSVGQYADFSNIQNYQQMLDTVRHAGDAFMALPAEMRKRFDNDPGQLLSFIQDKNNYDEALSLGLLNKKPLTKQQTNEQTQTNNQNSKPSTKTKTTDPTDS